VAALSAGISLLLVCLPLAGAEPAAPSEWPDWVDRQESLRQRIAAVNEGDLTFLDDAVDRTVHYHDGRIAISAQSLVDGWVSLEQCHYNLDRVAAAQILFRPERSRALEVLSYRNIDAAFAEANSIQLRGVGDASEICLRGESRALRLLGPDVFELQNGPFMRRFLDGYYPLRLSLRVEYPSRLTLADFDPQSQAGFDVRQTPGRVEVEAFFEGRLNTRFRFLAD